MKKTTVLLIAVLFMVIGYAAYNATINIYGNAKLAENLSDFKVYLSSLKVNGTEVEGINETKEEFKVEDINGNISVDIVNDSTEYDTEAYLECIKEDENVRKVWNYDYTGGEQTFTAPVTGTYKLETWGAQGGSYSTTFFGGYGGYSNGQVNLQAKEKIYINIGGQGNAQTGGYNGGGNVNDGDYGKAGGGATHIALTSGKLASFINKVESMIIVSGGGGGAANRGFGYGDGNGGAGGGIIGNNGESVNHTNGYGYAYGTGGSQTTGGRMIWIKGTADNTQECRGSFGSGYGSLSSVKVAAGGGGGFYGGGASGHGGAGGGSGYIGNSLLTEKTMYCYNCTESNETSTKTISTTCTSATPTSACAKSGNGYARITLTSSPTSITTDKVTISAQESSNQDLENITGKSLICKLKVNKISRTEKVYNGPTEWTFDYTGGEQIFTAPTTGIYKLEVWGAQGGVNDNTLDGKKYIGGYGGYSSGVINLSNKKEIFINVGDQGKISQGYGTSAVGSYNGGGDGFYVANSGCASNGFSSSGGGATHIALSSGVLSNLENNITDILIVAGGGGGAHYCNTWNGGFGGHGGGYTGGTSYNNLSDSSTNGYGTGGTQTSGGLTLPQNQISAVFGKSVEGSSTGGGGFYGGGNSDSGGAGGGSGYIGNSLLTEKAMYCYNCQESKDISTKTISTTCTSATPTANCSKQGNGYARITLVNVS